MRAEPKLSDEQLLARYRESGDLKLLDTLFERYHAGVASLCLSFYDDPAAAAAKAQEILTHARRWVHTCPPGGFRLWLYNIARCELEK